MSILLNSVIRLNGAYLKYKLDSAARDPQTFQRNLLLKILNRNKDTEYGMNHNFGQINNKTQFQKNIPINDYTDLKPYIDKIKNGESHVLTAENPFMFNVTSGTTSDPKYIPVTKTMKNHTANLMKQWLYRSLFDHPDLLSKSVLIITSAAVEGHTSANLPYGSVSGLIYKNLPKVLHHSYVLPFFLADIKNYLGVKIW